MPSSAMEKRYVDAFQVGMAHLNQYIAEQGTAKVKQVYVCDDGFRLGKWMTEKRRNYRNGNLPDYQRFALREAGVILNVRSTSWNNNCRKVQKYVEGGGTLSHLTDDTMEKGTYLRRWFYREFNKRDSGACSASRREGLEAIFKLSKKNSMNEDEYFIDF